MIAALALALPLSIATCQQSDAVLLVETSGDGFALILDAIKSAPSPQPLRRGATITYAQHGDGVVAAGRRYLMFVTVNWETGQMEFNTDSMYESRPTAQLHRVGPSPQALAADDDLHYGPESEVLARLRDAVARGACDPVRT